jgi:hypothetical protein
MMAWLTPAVRADLHFQQPAADAGEVRGGAVLVHRFAFKNTGLQAIEITGVQSGCGCLTPKIEKRVYAAGEEGSLALEVNTLNQAGGAHDWRVEVGWRAGRNENAVTLHLKARVVADMVVQPAALTIFANGAVNHEILVIDRRPQALTVTAARTSSSLLKAQVHGTERDAGGHQVWRIRLDVAGDCPTGRHDEYLVIDTSDPGYRDLKVPVTIIKRARAEGEGGGFPHDPHSHVWRPCWRLGPTIRAAKIGLRLRSRLTRERRSGYNTSA